MNTVTMPTDRDLVRSYAREGSETAFRALVSRHVDLVFATAYRQVGDTGLAEEITQNVFVRLARKATVLAGHETIAGWLHRCAILESKARFRAEMRRRRREEIAAALAETQRAGRDPTVDLSPLLDEALLQLREGDRMALVLRFLEERSFREVGAALGVDENAARQRVNRALSRMTEFFRRQGIALPTAGGAALLHQATLAAPVGLASTASAAGLAVGGPASGLGVALLFLMNLTKTQTALLCDALVLLPLGWQSFTVGKAEREVGFLRREWARFNDQLSANERELADLDRALLRLRNETAAQRVEMARIKDGIPKPKPDSMSQGPYRWDDRSPLVRLPKRLLAEIGTQGPANNQGKLSPEIRGILQLTDAETLKVQSAIDRFTAAYGRLVLELARPVEPTQKELASQSLDQHRGSGFWDLPGQSRDQVLAFEIRGLQEPARALHRSLLAELDTLVGLDRLKLLQSSWRNWICAPAAGNDINSQQLIFTEDHRFYAFPRGYSPANPTEPLIGYGVVVWNHGSFDGFFPLSDIPQFLRPLIQPLLDPALQTPPLPSATSISAKP